MLAILCDGIGGEAHGDTAAAVVAEHFINLPSDLDTKLAVVNEVFNANEQLLSCQRSNPAFHNMSTTLAGIAISSRSFLAFNVGDSRVYQLSGDRLKQISIDHTKAADLVKAGCLTDARYAPARFRNTVTRYLGGGGGECYPTVVQGEVTTAQGCFLLCSDGIYKFVADEVIEQALRSPASLQEKSRAVIDFAIHNGSTDDISLVLLQLVEYERTVVLSRSRPRQKKAELRR